MQFDILKFSTNMTEMKVQGNRISSLQQQNIQKAAARIFKNGQIYSSAVIGNIDSNALLEKAERPGNIGLAYDYELPKTASQQNHHSSPYTREAKLAAFKTFVEELQKDHPNLNWTGRYAIQNTGQSFHSSYSGHLEGSGESSEGHLLYKRFGSTDFAEGYLVFDSAETDFKMARAKVEPLLNAVELTSSIDAKKMPVLMLDSEIITGRLAKDIKPEKFHSGSSFLSGKMGDAIFSSQVTLQDLSYAPQFGRYVGFDGEGVLHSNPLVFNQGTFNQVLYDLRQAKKAGVASTGNGLRSFDTGINCRPHSLAFAPGKTPTWEMIKDLPECLVLVMSFGGAINDQWEFSNPVQVGFLFRHGKAVGRVPNVSVKGLLKDILGKDLIGIGSDSFIGSLSPTILTQLEVITH